MARQSRKTTLEKSALKNKCHSAVVVTGVSTGIGKAIALDLQQHGYLVFGTVRKATDGKYLQAAGGIPILMDVTKETSINNAARNIIQQLGELPLAGLINNAGISVCVPWEHLRMPDFREQMEVNLFGVLTVTRQFLTLLKRDHGKIIMISSTAGRFANALMGPYCCSKFALEALADSLRQELYQDKVPVISLQPGPIKTPIFEKSRQWTKKKYAHVIAAGHYGKFVSLSENLGQAGLSPERLARIVRRELQSQRPSIRRIVAQHPWHFWLQALLPIRLRDWLAVKILYGRSQNKK